MLNTDLSDLLVIGGQAVDIAIDILRTTDGHGALTPKGDRDYASELDLRIERELRVHLAKVTPHIGFYGEEEGSAGERSGLQWVLDPIDGTVNFVHGLPLHAVSLSLIEGTRPILGLVDLPAFNTRYQAADGCGAYCGEHRLPTSSPPADLASAIVAIGDYAVGDHAEAKNQPRFAVTARLASAVLRVRMLGTAAIDLAWLAAGRLDASVTMSNNTWDTSAGVVLARETGHQVVDASGDEHNLDAGSTIAAHPDLLPLLLVLINGPERGPLEA